MRLEGGYAFTLRHLGPHERLQGSALAQAWQVTHLAASRRISGLGVLALVDIVHLVQTLGPDANSR